MTDGPDPDLSGMPLPQLLDAISHDHAEASLAQQAQLQSMGRKAAEVYRRKEMSWRQIAAATGVSVRTLRRYAAPYL
jgi:hypothetical protein